MDKIAEVVKMAEVNGFVAGLVDTGILKVANEEEMAVVADVIAENLPEDYTMEDAMAVAAEVVDALEEGGEEEGEVLVDDEGMVVEASDKEASDKEEVNVTAVMAAYGELSMAKEAGEISEEEFKKEAGSLKGLFQGVKGLARKAYTGDAAKGVDSVVDAARGAKASLPSRKAIVDALSAKGLREGGRQAKRNFKFYAQQKPGAQKEVYRKKLLQGLGQAGKGAAATGAAYGTVGGAAYGGKSLYDKYNK
jgi:hypothetical protein